MAINPNFISPCGLYCGVCAIYIAARDNNIKLKERLVNLYKGGTPGMGTLPNSDKLSTENIHCGGCLSDDLFLHCQQCEIRSCTKEKGYKCFIRNALFSNTNCANCVACGLDLSIS
ncbi:MAG: DUF3795 domain-containing protein [Anaerolineaceae bacterium]|nr:MAG: DUF3795 domain-containing protein [Anaerolineaceae bacterium]